MRSVLTAMLTLFGMAGAQAQSSETMGSLIAQGYEVKAALTGGGAFFILQKGTSAYVCMATVVGADVNVYGSTFEAAKCGKIAGK